jgi:hypothetical protein
MNSHILTQEHYLNTIDGQNHHQEPGVGAAKPHGTTSKLSRQINKSLSKNWSKLRNALKGKDFLLMMNNAKKMGKTVKEMADGPVKDVLIRSVSSAAKVKQMLTSPVEDQNKFEKIIKSVWVWAKYAINL